MGPIQQGPIYIDGEKADRRFLQSWFIHYLKPYKNRDPKPIDRSRSKYPQITRITQISDVGCCSRPWKSRHLCGTRRGCQGNLSHLTDTQICDFRKPALISE